MSSSPLIWMAVFAVTIGAVLVSSALEEPLVHLVLTGVVSVGLAMMAIRDNRSQHAAGASSAVISADTARYMGLVWSWGAVCLLVTYLFVLDWREWWQFFLGALAAGVVCLFFAMVIDRDARSGRTDDTIVKLARTMAIVQLVGMVAAMIGIAIDPDKNFLTNRRPDWAAQSTFFFGAFSLALISAQALWADRKTAA